jgi:hypothetical protein
MSTCEEEQLTNEENQYIDYNLKFTRDTLMNKQLTNEQIKYLNEDYLEFMRDILVNQMHKNIILENFLFFFEGYQEENEKNKKFEEEHLLSQIPKEFFEANFYNTNFKFESHFHHSYNSNKLNHSYDDSHSDHSRESDYSYYNKKKLNMKTQRDKQMSLTNKQIQYINQYYLKLTRERSLIKSLGNRIYELNNKLIMASRWNFENKYHDVDNDEEKLLYLQEYRENLNVLIDRLMFYIKESNYDPTIQLSAEFQHFCEENKLDVNDRTMDETTYSILHGLDFDDKNGEEMEKMSDEDFKIQLLERREEFNWFLK